MIQKPAKVPVSHQLPAPEVRGDCPGAERCPLASNLHSKTTVSRNPQPKTRKFNRKTSKQLSLTHTNEAKKDNVGVSDMNLSRRELLLGAVAGAGLVCCCPVSERLLTVFSKPDVPLAAGMGGESESAACYEPVTNPRYKLAQEFTRRISRISSPTAIRRRLRWIMRRMRQNNGRRGD